MKMACHAVNMWGGSPFFTPMWAASVPGGFFAFLCHTEHNLLPGLVWAILSRCQVLLLLEGIPHDPHLRKGRFPDSQDDLGLSSCPSVALGTAPLVRAPLWLCSCLLPSQLQGTTHALALSGSLAHCKLGVGLSCGLSMAPFSMGPCIHPELPFFSSPACKAGTGQA